jgi:hypothetical protein
MGRSTFNWWRRHKKRKTLPKYHPLLSRIRNGDFDTSQYLQEAQTELDTYNDIVRRCTAEGKELDLRIDTINQRIFDEGDQYMRRYNRLMKDFYADEDRLHHDIRVAFRKQFGQALDHLYNRWLDGKESDMTLEELYHKCQDMKDKGRRVTRRKNRKRKKSLPEVIYGISNE